MISYQPALDRFHTVFRLTCLTKGLLDCYPLEVDKFRILDFYVAFPFRLEGFVAKQGHTAVKKVGKAYAYAQPYGGIPDDTSLFLRMAPVQSLAMDTLAAHGMVDPDGYKQGMIMLGESEVPAALAEGARAFVAEHLDLFDVLQKLACEYTLLGEDGLKRRSGLMEYKYDAA